jgi:hypothetical protein
VQRLDIPRMTKWNSREGDKIKRERESENERERERMNTTHGA